MSQDYTLTVNGHPMFVHQARVSSHPLNQVWPGYRRPLEQTELTFSDSLSVLLAEIKLPITL
jgi:hypothetical protein